MLLEQPKSIYVSTLLWFHFTATRFRCSVSLKAISQSEYKCLKYKYVSYSVHYVVMSVYLLGQCLSKQSLTSRPMPVQSWPPDAGLGNTHQRLLDDLPGPHDREHWFHGVHSDQAPSTTHTYIDTLHTSIKQNVDRMEDLQLMTMWNIIACCGSSPVQTKSNR